MKKTNWKKLGFEFLSIFIAVISAFEALTPGRQRGYLLFFSAPKQSKTPTARIEKSIEKILYGEGRHDKYNRKK